MVVSTLRRPRTLRQNLSFYVPGSNQELVSASAAIAGAVTLKGPKGPEAARVLRRDGFDGEVLFDLAAYEGDPEKNSVRKPVDPRWWIDTQHQLGADRVLSPGRWVPWDSSGATLRAAVELEAGLMVSAPGSTLVFAIDYRWLTKGLRELTAALRDVDRPVALVLSHSNDPLGVSDAVDALVAVVQSVPDLSILRCDHGAIGAVAFGAGHGSMGLVPTYRHFVPPTSSGGGKRDDRTARLFIRDIIDWTTAFEVSGWSVIDARPPCLLRCCDGRPFERFLDDRTAGEAMLHNQLSLLELGRLALDSAAAEPRFAFPTICASAVKRYGPVGGFTTTIKPKAQLVQWSQLAR